MFQMKFYAVALLRSRGVLPARLRLIYLANGQLLDYSPDLDELLRFEKTLMAIWRAIQSAGATGDFRPTPSRMCNWCAHQSLCPVFGGTPPPYPGWPERVGIVTSCYYRRLPPIGDVQALRVHRVHGQQLGSEYPARLAAAGVDDQADRGTGGRPACGSAGWCSTSSGPFRWHPCGFGPGCSAPAPGSRCDRRDVGHSPRRLTAHGRRRLGVVVGHRRYRRRRQRPLSPYRRGRGGSDPPRLAGRARLSRLDQVGAAARGRRRRGGVVAEPAGVAGGRRRCHRYAAAGHGGRLGQRGREPRSTPTSSCS